MMVGQSEAFDKALAEVRDRFLFDLDQRICDLEYLKSHIVNGPDGVAAARAVAMMAHKIRGVAPTLGFAQLGGLAASTEKLFSTAGKHPDLAAFWRVAAPVFEDLLDEMERVQPNYSTG